MDGKTRGGARPGAGRKKIDAKRVTLSCRVAPETKAQLAALAKSSGKSLGEVLDALAKSK